VGVKPGPVSRPGARRGRRGRRCRSAVSGGRSRPGR
jgi:hypothetical protein